MMTAGRRSARVALRICAAGVLAGCSSASTSTSPASQAPTPAPPGLTEGNCVAAGTITTAATPSTPDQYRIGLTGVWEDVSVSHQPRFTVWLRRDRSPDDALRIADVSRAGFTDVDAAVAHARSADAGEGARLGDVHHCTVAGERTAFYSADYPTRAHAVLLFLVHNRHTYQVEIDSAIGDGDVVSAEAKIMLGSWRWG